MKRGKDGLRDPEMWDCPGGHFLNEKESAEECMLREAKEECGLEVEIKRAGKVFEFHDNYGRAVAIPFLLGLKSNTGDKSVKLSEHTEYKWIEPRELSNYNCTQDVIEAAIIFGLI